MFLDDSQEVAKILHNLIEGTEVRLSTVPDYSGWPFAPGVLLLCKQVQCSHNASLRACRTMPSWRIKSALTSLRMRCNHSCSRYVRSTGIYVMPSPVLQLN